MLVSKKLSLRVVALQAALVLAIGGAIGSAYASSLVKLAVTPVPHGDIANFIKPILAKDGVELQVVEFNDYIQPKQALLAKDVDADFTATTPFLRSFEQQHHVKLDTLAAVHIEPVGLYSNKVKSLSEIPNKALVAIPSYPSVENRALKLLESLGLITLKGSDSELRTVRDIVDNPKQLRFYEVEPAQVPRTLEDVDVAVINANYALAAGLNPKKDAFALESISSPYANIVVVRPGDIQRPELQKLKQVITSPAVKKFITEKYKGAVVPAF